jgi:hypothetical protein
VDTFGDFVTAPQRFSFFFNANFSGNRFRTATVKERREIAHEMKETGD